MVVASAYGDLEILLAEACSSLQTPHQPTGACTPQSGTAWCSSMSSPGRRCRSVNCRPRISTCRSRWQTLRQPCWTIRGPRSRPAPNQRPGRHLSRGAGSMQAPPRRAALRAPRRKGPSRSPAEAAAAGSCRGRARGCQPAPSCPTATTEGAGVARLGGHVQGAP